MSPEPVAIGTLTPDNGEDRADVHGSPSFDYHEERRLHLKDEIWLSHHLPRLPPPALSESVSSIASLDGTRTLRTKTAPSETVPSSQTIDASPSAFHPRGMTIPAGEARAGGEEVKEGKSWTDRGFPGSSMLSPSGPEDGDLDPAPTLIHRTELDEQERLDLEEEERERMLGERSGLAGVAHLNLGPGAGDKNTAVVAEPGE
jgi:AMP deaminase